MAAKTRSNAQIAHDRREITHLYLNEKLSQAEIGKRLDMTQQMVSYDLCRLQEMWVAAALMDLTEAKSRELARIDRLEREYWDAWERSKEDKETVTKEKTEGEKAGRAKVQMRSEGQTGNPAFLSGLQWCVERRCKLLGLDAPQRHEVGGVGGKPIMLGYSGNVDPDGDL